MHYKNGREAKLGDLVLAKTYSGVPFTAVVVATSPGASTCNLQLQPIDPMTPITATAKECMHADDVAEFINRATPASAGI